MHLGNFNSIAENFKLELSIINFFELLKFYITVDLFQEIGIYFVDIIGQA